MLLYYIKHENYWHIEDEVAGYCFPEAQHTYQISQLFRITLSLSKLKKNSIQYNGKDMSEVPDSAVALFNVWVKTYLKCPTLL